MTLNYIELSDKYRPIQIKTLLIGEAPPPSGKKYFYLPQSLNDNIPIKEDRSLPATIFWHYFQCRPQNQEEYILLLDKLKDLGIFLVDIWDEPIKIRGNKENEGKLVAEIPNLRNKLQQRGITIPEDKMIFLLARNSYKKAIREHFKSASLIPWIEFRLNFKPINISQ